MKPATAMELATRNAAKADRRLDDEAEKNRAAMPIVSAFVDEMRKEFLPSNGFRVTYAEENGIVRGHRGPPGVKPGIKPRDPRDVATADARGRGAGQK